jgi:branched-chain amino acid transport system ATP-binding protein
MTGTLLEIAGVEAGYGDVQVLWGVDLKVEPGQIGCLIGSNGAGKSTLLRCISGLVPARAGSIRFDGVDLAGAAPAAIVGAGIGHVPEGRRLFAGMSVRDNLLMGAYQRRDGARAVDADLDRVYGIFPRLAERRRQDAATLSGGEQQMCAIARGLMARPKLLMIDELSLGLAPRLVEELMETLRRINADGLTILLVEQDVITALELASYAYVLNNGRIVLEGPASALARDPTVREAYLGAPDAAAEALEAVAHE